MAEMNKMRDSLEYAIEHRSTIRELTGGNIRKGDFQRLIRAACGNTHSERGIKMRPAPSAGATYPVEIYTVLERIEGVSDGLYRYSFDSERPVLVETGRFLESICRVSLDQDFIPLANLGFILIYNPARIVRRYGRDSRKYALLECGHIAQNILLMAASLGLGAVPVGAFYRKRLEAILKTRHPREALYMIFVGTIDH